MVIVPVPLLPGPLLPREAMLSVPLLTVKAPLNVLLVLLRVSIPPPSFTKPSVFPPGFAMLLG